MSAPADFPKTATAYDIQGQVKTPESDVVTPPTGYWANTNAYSPAGDGNDTIPSTSPGLQEPVVPGKVLTNLQKADLSAQTPIAEDPVNSAVNANAQAMKAAGQISVSQQDEIDRDIGKGVANAAGSGIQ
jgi:hypothetical protein